MNGGNNLNNLIESNLENVAVKDYLLRQHSSFGKGLWHQINLIFLLPTVHNHTRRKICFATDSKLTKIQRINWLLTICMKGEFGASWIFLIVPGLMALTSLEICE
jgi:hypothetical protein